MSRRLKVSLTLDSAVAAAVDEATAQAARSNRSEVVERASRAWLRERRRLALAEEVAAYYGATTAAEGAEDASWAALGDDTVRRGWGG